MQYNLTSDLQRNAFLSRVKILLERGAVVELTEKTACNSLSPFYHQKKILCFQC